jgi:plasmid stabilization system protein ParE
VAHRVAPRAEADLDDIWLYVAKESGSMDVATRLIDAITGRFFLLATFPFAGRGSLPSKIVQGRKGFVLRQVPKLARLIEQPTVIHTALVCRIRFQDNLTSIGRPGHRERRATLDRLQVRQALLDVNFHMRAASHEVEHLNERVLAAFGDHAKNVLAIVRETV